MIERLHVKSFGCLKEVLTPPLTRIHAFIGPNDSGKSTLLEAVEAISWLARGLANPNLSFDPAPVARAGPEAFLAAEASGYVLHAKRHPGVRPASSGPFRTELRSGSLPLLAASQEEGNASVVEAALSWSSTATFNQAVDPVRMLRLDPDELREESGLIPSHSVVDFRSPRGLGLPGVYDAILNRGDQAFFEIADRVATHFPTVKRLRLRAATETTKVLEVELVDGTIVPARGMSEGMLYYLAFEALQYLQPAAVTLVEEPENGLHPSRIADVVQALRAMTDSGGTQVLMATHSPLVVNELKPHEVTVVTRDNDRGTQVRLLSDTPNFVDRSKVYAPGELWLSYANGIDESPLLDGTTK